MAAGIPTSTVLLLSLATAISRARTSRDCRDAVRRAKRRTRRGPVWFGSQRGMPPRLARAGVFGAVGDLLCRCARLRSAIKKRLGCKCVRFGIPFSRDPRNPDVGKLLEQGARFGVQGS